MADGRGQTGSAAPSEKAPSVAGSARSAAASGSGKALGGSTAGSVRAASHARSNAGSHTGSQRSSRAGHQAGSHKGSGGGGGGSFKKDGRKEGGKQKGEKKSTKFGDWDGSVACGSQDAGIGSTHTNVAAPRHLSGLDPQNATDERLTKRLVVPNQVPAWVANRDRTHAQYELALREEANRLREKDVQDAHTLAKEEMRKNLQEFKRLQKKAWSDDKDWTDMTTPDPHYVVHMGMRVYIIHTCMHTCRSDVKDQAEKTRRSVVNKVSQVAHEHMHAGG